MSDSSNTATNSKPKAKPRGRPFVKGDPRINRKGRPKSFDALRELAQVIAHEKAQTKGGATMVIDGHSVTNAEAIMRKWALSNDPRLQKAFVEIAFGKVPQPLEHSGPGGGPIESEVKTGVLTDEHHDAILLAIFDRARARARAANGGTE